LTGEIASSVLAVVVVTGEVVGVAVVVVVVNVGLTVGGGLAAA